MPVNALETIWAPMADSKIRPHSFLLRMASLKVKSLYTVFNALLYTWNLGALALWRDLSIANFCSPVSNPLSPSEFKYPASVVVFPASCNAPTILVKETISPE